MHLPRPIPHHQANLPMTVIKVTETEIFQSHAVFDDRRDNRLEAYAMRYMRFDLNCVHTRGNFTGRPLPTVANFRGV